MKPFLTVSDLDRLLCERLGIAPAIPARHEFRDQRGRPRACTCGARADEGRALDEKCPARCDHFPRLSATGEGMLTLIKALRAQGHSAHLSGYPEAVRAMVNPRGGEHGFATGEDEPLALALAAANALEIKVPG